MSLARVQNRQCFSALPAGTKVLENSRGADDAVLQACSAVTVYGAVIGNSPRCVKVNHEPCSHCASLHETVQQGDSGREGQGGGVHAKSVQQPEAEYPSVYRQY